MIPDHWIRPNEASRLPRRHIVFDCEARRDRTGGGEVQSWLCAVASFDHQHDKSRKPAPTEWGRFDIPEALWAWVDDRTRPRYRTVVVAHNLAYDLRISRALSILPERGWALRGIRIDGDGSWATWRRADRNLTMVDTLSWFPTSLANVGRAVGIDKPRLPDTSTLTPKVWERCETDVRILRAAWLRTLGWLEAEDMGNWRISGAGQAWAAWRHRWYTHKVLIRSDAAHRVTERESIWTGRTEAWRWGQLKGGPFTEWDFAHAYASICRDHDLPRGYRGRVSRPSLRTFRSAVRHYAVLARVTVTTDTPTLPARSPEGICWPVGRFSTVVWGDELAAALDDGADVTFDELWTYDRAPVLRAWGEWVCDLLDRPRDEVDPVVRLVVKHWSRALVGRTGMRWSSWTPYGRAPSSDVVLRRLVGPAAGESSRLLQLGRDLYVNGVQADGADACPMILAAVAGLTRMRLWSAMQAAGLEHVAYVDTDGLLVDAEGSRALERASIVDLRAKAVHRSATVLGPRQLVLGATLRAAGVRAAAVRVGRQRWAMDVWRQLSTSLSAGEADRVRVSPRTVSLVGTDHRRDHQARGLTAARVAGPEWPLCAPEAPASAVVTGVRAGGSWATA